MLNGANRKLCGNHWFQSWSLSSLNVLKYVQFFFKSSQVSEDPASKVGLGMPLMRTCIVDLLLAMMISYGWIVDSSCLKGILVESLFAGELRHRTHAGFHMQDIAASWTS